MGTILTTFGHLETVKWIGGPNLLLNMYLSFYNSMLFIRAIRMRLSMPSGTSVEREFKGWKIPYKSVISSYFI